ncbi:multicopper oxidase domain-containing protein [Lapillicoccus jejuensis]|uniref:Multicopper oxidase n=1 Tax=Lapillicoccus jejuensis TaxID=402171 RepID=A0A542E308_9MICO|nr:multicopper oxidase domain-containing protein [Lapillicoccus jejuensis]TQJ09679.1 multicopper oxidase [Lapillicoccus jejuensis]
MMLPKNTSLSRRALLAGAGAMGMAVVGGRLVAPAVATPAAAPATLAGPAGPAKKVHLVGTDGWAAMPGSAPKDPPFFPDPLAPGDLNTYIFGFRDATGLDAAATAALRGHAQISAPMMWFDELDEITITLTNLGLVQRPDLFDGHTLHWHGFVNAIPLFDGVPELSLSVPIGRDFDYFYKVRDAGTYMYHCHFEDVEHVQMGMTGMVFVRPAQNKGTGSLPPGRYAYNDGDGSTRYDREYAFMMTEIWSAAHYRDAHIQVNDWTDFDPSFSCLNGRAWPDTVADNGNPMSTAAGALQYQPITSRIQARPGERVLLRLSSLSYNDHSLTCDEIPLTVVAKDASLLRGRDGTTNYQTTNTVTVGAGESRDVLFTAPDREGTYLLYDRDYNFLANGGGAGYGGMMTQVVVSAAAPAQQYPNDLTHDFPYDVGSAV